MRKIDYAIRTIMIVSIPSMVGFIVLSKPIVLLLFPQKETFMEASNLLRYLSVTTVFYSLSTLTNAILQSVGKANIAVVNAAVALIIQTILLVPLLIFTDLNLYCLVIVAIVYSFVMCILNRFFVRKYLGYRQEIMNTFLLPLIASVCMGIAAITIYKGMYYLVNSNAVATITSVIIAATLYFVIIIRIGVIREEELVRFPKGYLLVKLLRKK